MTHNASLVTALQLQTESQGVSRKIAVDSPTSVAARLRHALKSSESHSSIRRGGTPGGTTSSPVRAAELSPSGTASLLAFLLCPRPLPPPCRPRLLPVDPSSSPIAASGDSAAARATCRPQRQLGRFSTPTRASSAPP